MRDPRIQNLIDALDVVLTAQLPKDSAEWPVARGIFETLRTPLPAVRKPGFEALPAPDLLAEALEIPRAEKGDLARVADAFAPEFEGDVEIAAEPEWRGDEDINETFLGPSNAIHAESEGGVGVCWAAGGELDGVTSFDGPLVGEVAGLSHERIQNCRAFFFFAGCEVPAESHPVEFDAVDVVSFEEFDE